MDKREEDQPNSHGFCNRLLNFIRKMFTPITLNLESVIVWCSFCCDFVVCYWPFNFIFRNLSGHAIKPVPLEPSVHHGSLQVLTSNDNSQNQEPEAHEWSCDQGGLSSDNDGEKDGKDSYLDDEKMREEVVVTPTTTTQVRNPPKKTVSFDDRAEVINPSKDKKKKKKETKKLPSMERDRNEKPKPVRSILKIGSNQNVKQEIEQSKL